MERVLAKVVLSWPKDGHLFISEACGISRETWILRPYRNKREQTLTTSSQTYNPFPRKNSLYGVKEQTWAKDRWPYVQIPTLSVT